MDDVVIVGAGPTGLVLAIELATAGVRPVVLERLTERSTEPRANGLAGRVVTALDHRGLLEPLRAEAGYCGPVPAYPFAAMTLPLHRLGPDNPIRVLQIPQPVLERVLQEHALRLGVVIHRGQELTGLRQHAAGVELEIAGGPNRTARHLVGADGGRSTVRKLAGIEFPGHSDEATVMRLGRVTLPAELLSERGELVVPGFGTLAPTSWTRTETGVIAFGSFTPGSYLLSTVEHSGAAPDGPMELAELNAAVDRVLGAHVPITGVAEPGSLRRRAGQQTRLARDYVAGRVLLVGDAAHVHSAIGGPGLNLGVQDALNLGWKLAAQVRGWAPAGLLASYQAERRPVGERVMTASLTQLGLLRSGPEVTALRAVFGELLDDDTALRRIADLMAGTDIRYPMPLAQPHPLLGGFAPDLEVTTVDGPARVAELLRPAGALLLDLTGTVERPDAWDDRVRLVRAECPNPPAEALLIRPDGYVAWAGGSGLAETLHAWFGAPVARKIHQS
jgi:2-polyprenyl-6-methoxyphenol hydroxylase-like FAD-dependent oxidoreductase